MENLIKTFKGSGVELEYLLTGENNSEVIMFVHGAGANLRQFYLQHKYFSTRYKVLSVSLRGHGRSGRPSINSGDYYTLEKNKNDLLDLLEGLNIKKIHYVGNSAGGVIGFLMVEARPELFSSLVTYGTVGELSYSAFLTRIISGIDKAMLRWNSKRYLEFMSKNISKYESVQKEVFSLFMMSTETVPYIRENLGKYSCINIIKKMTVPYLLIRGEQDKEINRILTPTIEAIETNSRAKVIEIDQAGHIANLDRPDEFNEILDIFWNPVGKKSEYVISL